MRVCIDFDVEVTDLNSDAIHDLIADWTYDMRTSRRLRGETWKIHYNAVGGK